MEEEYNKMDVVKKAFLTAEQGQVYESVINHIEKALIEEALQRSSGNKLEAAKTLGINRNTLHAKMRKLKIDAEQFKR